MDRFLDKNGSRPPGSDTTDQSCGPSPAFQHAQGMDVSDDPSQTTSQPSDPQTVWIAQAVTVLLVPTITSLVEKAGMEHFRKELS